MAYDRSDPRDQQSRWRDERNSGRWEGRDPRGGRGNPDDRGFFDRASDEVASWFGDDEAERRRREGMGVLVVSHLLSERERLTRVYQLRDGRCEVV